MPQNTTLYTLLISCPGDVIEEIEIIKAAVEKFNELYSKALGITIQPKHWSKSSYAQSGGKPQSLLNEQFIKDCDAAVAIFWTRFGSPTDEYGSGTEEEIEIMLNADKQVFMYFSDKMKKPSEINSEEYEKIQAFRGKYKDKGIYFTYSSNNEFKDIFFAHLSMYFLSQKRLSELSAEHNSSLKICTLNEDNKLCDTICVQKFKFNKEHDVSYYKKIIRVLFDEINNIAIKTISNSQDGNEVTTINDVLETNIFSHMYENVKLHKNIIQTINLMANNLNIKLNDDFFNIGNLRKSCFPIDDKFNGTEDEIKKYDLIHSLYATIIELFDWSPIEKAFENLSCIKFALINCGTTFDEDIEVSIIVPQDKIIMLENFPELEYDNMKYLYSECDMNVLFGIEETAEYQKYQFPVITKAIAPDYTPLSCFSGTDYEEEYMDSLKDVFCYKFFKDNDNLIIKLSFEYIKHNTAIAFPTPLFITKDISKIEYKITSKNFFQVIKGTIEKE